MKPITKYFLTIAAITVSIATFAQDKYFVQFTNKTGTPYSTDNPSAFLSERSVNRRTKQGIAITETDLPVNPGYIQQIEATGAIVDFPLKWFNGAVITTTNVNQLTAIQNLSFISNTTEIYKSSGKSIKQKFDIDNNAGNKKNRLITNDLNYGNSSTQIKMLNGHLLHNSGLLGDGVRIALLDAGFLDVNTIAAFDSLRINNRILGVKDFVNPKSNIYKEHHHGTMVLSTMGGYSQGHLIGTAPHAEYWLIRTENANVEQLYEEYCWAAGAEFADSVGADIINSSLGYTTFDIESQNHTYNDLDGAATPITQAANTAASKGMLVVVSAGNEGSNAWHYISAPADSPNVLTVGAVNSSKQRAYFSSFGPTSDGRIKPDVCALGENAVIANTDGIYPANGTSFSGPIIAGMAACLWQSDPTLSCNELIQLIKSNASQANSPNNSTGYGIPDFAAAINIYPPPEKNSQMQICPNPFSQSINITLPITPNHPIECRVYTMSGAEIYHQTELSTLSTFELQLPLQLASGIYIIKVQTGANTYYAKGIKLQP